MARKTKQAAPLHLRLSEPSPRKDKFLMVATSPEEHEYVKQQAAARGMTVSDLVRKALDLYLESK